MELFKIVEAEECFFAIAPRPEASSLKCECDMLRSCGIAAVVSLIEPNEETTHGLNDESVFLRSAGIQFLRYPMADRAAPQDVNQLKAAIRDVLAHLTCGKSIVVHCIGGIGRSGLVALGVLTNQGRDVETALSMVSRARGRTAPDAPAQIEWYKRNAFRLQIDT